MTLQSCIPASRAVLRAPEVWGGNKQDNLQKFLGSRSVPETFPRMESVIPSLGEGLRQVQLCNTWNSSRFPAEDTQVKQSSAAEKREKPNPGKKKYNGNSKFIILRKR